MHIWSVGVHMHIWSGGSPLDEGSLGVEVRDLAHEGVRRRDARDITRIAVEDGAHGVAHIAALLVDAREQRRIEPGLGRPVVGLARRLWAGAHVYCRVADKIDVRMVGWSPIASREHLPFTSLIVARHKVKLREQIGAVRPVACW